MEQVERYLEGRHAVVTGGSRGIGAAIAGALSARGAAVTVMARQAGGLNEQMTTREHAGAKAQSVACDVTDDSSVQAAFARATDRFGAIGILVNSAGAAESALAGETSRALWDRMLAVNLTGTYACTLQVLPGMRAAGQGRVVNVASTAGLRGYKTMTAYCAAKHAVIGFTRALALETATQGITVNAVCPGYTETDLVDAAVRNLVSSLGKTPAEARAMLLRVIPRGIMTTPGEVAAAVVWLCAPGSAAVTGIALPVAGGEVG